jgi:hypothetical protein
MRKTFRAASAAYFCPLTQRPSASRSSSVMAV